MKGYLIEKYLGEVKDYKSRFKTWRQYIERDLSTEKQMKAIVDMESKGFKIVIWESDFVAMTDEKGNSAEVYKNGNVKHIKKK